MGDMAGANRGEVLYNPIHTAPSQDEFQLTQLSRRPTRSTVRPSRFRDEAFETQFQPGRKKKIRKMCFHPGRGDFPGFSAVGNVSSFDGEQQKEQQRYSPSFGLVKEGVSKQIGQTSSSLNWPTEWSSSQGCRTTGCKNRYFSGSRPKMNRPSLPKLGRPTRQENGFKSRKLSHGKF